MPTVTAQPPRDALIGVALERRYRIDALIARGGMSSVYFGLDLRLDRPVAVKVMAPQYSADPSFLARLEFEARAVARLKDPGLVPVYDQGLDGDYAFLVMELVEGGTLRELLRERGPMPPHAVAAVADPVLGGLGKAHLAGLVHRDVKPENVLISDNGEVKVVDFGLVRAIAEAGITSNSVILGTAAYLSPEQVESTVADARSDVYSSGILIYEMLTGTTPFTGDTPLSLAYARLQHDVPPPSHQIAGVPRAFDDLVLTATARDPRDRYIDAADMQSALLDIIDRLDLPPFTVPAPTRSAERESVAAFRYAYDPERTHDLRPPPPAPAGPGHTRVQSVPVEPDRDRSRDDYDRDDRRDDGYDYDDRAPADYDGRPAGNVSAASTAITPLSAAADTYADRRRARRRLAQIWLTIVLILAIALGIAGWWIASHQIMHSSAPVTPPTPAVAAVLTT
ncbi:protein kinase domain-containing protein [Jongsikchunia kroppenstedtii]|uniref:protein kinase domain-containing protein n=1 Tax=Jongsikchunia kroppenstedtii TaxID=1121721 RepID=UPI0009D9F8B1|nr:protein kinase [Jongsikchunia kroppenstedtii]